MINNLSLKVHHKLSIKHYNEHKHHYYYTIQLGMNLNIILNDKSIYQHKLNNFHHHHHYKFNMIHDMVSIIY